MGRPTRSVITGMAEAADGAVLGYSLHEPEARPEARVALIHALGMDRTNWDAVVAALPASFAVLAVDCRGHGEGRGETRLGLDLMADDLATVMETVGWSSALVAGCSMGGCVAQAFAARHPARIEALLLIDTTAWYGPIGPADWRARAERAKAEGLSALVAFQLDRWFTAGFRRDHATEVERTVSSFLANDLGSYEAACRMLGEADLRQMLAKIACPTAIMVGEEDYATPVSAASALHEAIAGSELIVLKGARHFTPVERPDEIAEAIVDLHARASRAVTSPSAALP